MASRSFFARHPVVSTLLGLLVLLVVAGGVFVASNRDNLTPELLNVNLNVKEITPDSLKAQVGIRLRNGLPVALRVDSFQYQMKVEGEPLARGSKRDPSEVKARSEGQIDLPLNVNLGEIAEKVRTLQRDSARVAVQMTLFAHFPLVGTQRIPVEMEKAVYIPKLPKFEIAGVKLEKLGLKESKVLVRLKVTNYNSFPFTIRRFTYNFRLSDNLETKGTENEDITFEKVGTETITIPVTMKFDQVGELIFKSLFKSEETPYRMDAKVHITSDQKFIQNIDMDINSKGNLRDLKEAIKQK